MIIIDRFEENLAVCTNTDNNLTLNINISKLPENVAEGDVLVYCNGTYIIDEATTNERKKNLQAKLNALFQKYKRG
jgi:vacuolar-type H+-ATPase subunit E/Vma4